MTMDPSNYDPERLRRAARARSESTDPVGSTDATEPASRSSSDGPMEAADGDQLKNLLLMESSASADQLERPYLTEIPGKYAAEITMFEWLDFLLGNVGLRGTLDAIDFYVRVGWVGEEAAEDLRNHVRGFRELATEGETTDLDPADHVVSLRYIARLAAMS